MADSHTTLQAYISKILDLKDGLSENQILTPEDLKKAALEMGLSARQWQQLMDECEDHITRGIGYAKFNNWDDSISELEQALEINPFSFKTLHHLAISHKEKWDSKGDSSDKEKAISYAERCLRIQPNHESSLALISELKNSGSSFNPIQKGRSSSSIRMPLVAGALLALLLLGGLAYFNMQPVETPQTPEVPAINQPPETPPVEAPVLGTPLIFLENEKSKNLTFAAQVSDLEKYEGSYSYKLKGLIDVNQMEVSKITLKVDLIDQNGQIIHSKTADALSEHQPVHRHGDQIAVGVSVFNKAELPGNFKEVQVSVENILATASEAKKMDAPLIKVEWQQSKPANIDFEVRERLMNASDNIMGGVFYKLNWELFNTGKLSIKSLKMDIIWLDENGDEIDRKNTYFVSGGAPVIKVNARRLAGGTYSLKEVSRDQIKGYRLSVNSIDY